MPSSRKPRKSAARDAHPSLAPYRQKDRGERLQKVLADAGVAARRECERLIVEGAVTVNGKTIDTLPAWADPEMDRIEVYGKPLRPAEKHVYIMLFKPRGTVCTNSDPEGRPRAIDLVNHPSRARMYCVGRLDLDASGLLILTNDGEFANRLTHPRYEVPKGYDVTLDGRLDAAAIAEMERKIFSSGRGTGGKADTASDLRSTLRLVSADATKSMVHLELCEHRNLQLRELMLSLGHPVKKLRRTSFGPLKLKGLAVGEWRELTGREIEMLRKASAPGARAKRVRESHQRAEHGQAMRTAHGQASQTGKGGRKRGADVRKSARETGQASQGRETGQASQEPIRKGPKFHPHKRASDTSGHVSAARGGKSGTTPASRTRSEAARDPSPRVSGERGPRQHGQTSRVSQASQAPRGRTGRLASGKRPR
jgi:23S rRNA pseudouridine2605 synthase